MSIFVSIANYRDSQTPHTVNDLLSKAKYKDQITVGVFSQINKQTDQHCLAPRYKSVVQEVVDYTTSKGVCWARSFLLSKMRGDQDYVLQIDSHTRFVRDWDEILIDMLAQCGDKSVLTTYPAGYQPPNVFDEPNRYLRLSVRSIDPHGVPVLSASALPIEQAPSIPQRNAFYSGNFSFTKGVTYDQVPYDPYIYFLGEETTMAVRLYTHGYNLYTPNKHVLWHQFNIDKLQPNKPARRLHWTDNPWLHLEDMSRLRIQYLLNIRKSIDPDVLPEIKKYGLGNIRTLNQYQEFAGIYFKTRHLDERATTGDYV